MTSPQIKAKISELLYQLPGNSLNYILDILKEARSKSPNSIEFAGTLKKVISENKELLQKLT